jgi:arginine:pyruvate transaminase
LRFSPLVDRIGGQGADAWRVHVTARQARAAGREIIFLTVGDPDQETAPPIIDATIQALRDGHTRYSAIAGHPALRAAIAARTNRLSGAECEPDNVIIVPGAQAGLFCALQCLAGPGDEVILPEPRYATYEAVIGAAGAAMVAVPLRSEHGFHPDIAELARAVTPRTRAIWINSPHNPTGAVLTGPELDGIAELCRRHDLWLISDEVYDTLAYEAPHVSPRALPGMAERSVVVSSLSKSHALPGFRLGWIVAPPALIEHLSNLVLCMLYGSPPFIQAGAVAALQLELPGFTAMAEIYRRRARLMIGLLAEAPRCRVIPPQGGMFVLLDIRATGLGAEAFALALLEREGVAVLPCDGFGPSAAGHLRISLTAPEKMLTEAGARIVRFARSL